MKASWKIIHGSDALVRGKQQCDIVDGKWKSWLWSLSSHIISFSAKSQLGKSFLCLNHHVISYFYFAQKKVLKSLFWFFFFTSFCYIGFRFMNFVNNVNITKKNPRRQLIHLLLLILFNEAVNTKMLFLFSSFPQAWNEY